MIYDCYQPDEVKQKGKEKEKMFTNYYDPDRNGINHNMGWECPRCGRINAPWLPNCSCDRNDVKVSYTKDTTTTAPNGYSYSTNYTAPDSFYNQIDFDDYVDEYKKMQEEKKKEKELDEKDKILQEWWEKLP